MLILHEWSITTARDGVWRVRVRHDRPLYPCRVDGRWRWTRHYMLQMAPPDWPDQWETVTRTADEATRHRWLA